ncbi:MAG: LysR family transcriptional regulator [Burkholderiales bacterium]|nr:LysR family transcriptional regulator [Burkholderiales bacterium]
MDRLQGMKVFVQVAHHAGFAAAARELRMSTAAVSKHVTALEARLGTRLFDRTTRHVGLTEAGRVYLDRCVECLQALEDADASVGELAGEPRGLLRVTAPVDFCGCLMPVLVDLMNAQPHVLVDLRLSNRVVDLVEEGVDVAVRAAGSLDGRYVARPIARTRLAMFGAPSYFARHGRPSQPEDLPSHRGIVFVEPRPRDDLVFARDGREVRVKLNAAMTSNSGDAVQNALRAGVGLALAPSFLVREDLVAGRIEPVLLDWSLPEYRLFAVYPHRRLLSPKVAVFLEALRAHFGDGSRDPWWPQTPGACAQSGSCVRPGARRRLARSR